MAQQNRTRSGTSDVLQTQGAKDGLHDKAPVLIVSPHYDDAVFSCGDLLAARPGSTVVTVFAAMPAQSNCSTDWDRRCGFASAGEAMRRREDENHNALTRLAAKAVDLDFLDSQYVEDPAVDADRLRRTLSSTLAQARAAAVFAPLGLFHGDHIRCSDALMAIYPSCGTVQWFVYEEIPYRRHEGLVQERLSWLLAQGLRATPANLRTTAGRKAAAIAAYGTQLTALGPESGTRILEQPECYWSLSRRGESPP